MTTFDRYLLSRYAHVFFVLFVAAMGLYVVVDGFTNLDDFQAQAGGGTWDMLSLMARHYLCHSSMIFELLGPTLAVTSVMCVLALALRHGEIYPVLAAGVPMYRLAAPFVVGVLSVNGLLALNQEWIIPRISNQLQRSRGDGADHAERVEPTYDSHMIFINGEELSLEEQTIHEAEFIVNTPLVEHDTALRAPEAVYYPREGDQPAGWRLKNAQPQLDDVALTESGRAIVLRTDVPGEIFVCSELSFDSLYNRSTSFKYLPTRELVQRIRRPASGGLIRRAQILHLHSRLTRPLLTLIGLFLVIPIIAQRERMNLVTNVAVCMGVLGVVYGLSIGLLMLGNTGLMRPEQCAWLPLIFGGGLCGWLAPAVRT